jgi:hypothetical protein
VSFWRALAGGFVGTLVLTSALALASELGFTRIDLPFLLALVNVLLPAVHPRMGTPFSSARDTPLLEPPGFMLLNYGRATPLVTVLAHVAYGAIIGFLIGSAP